VVENLITNQQRVVLAREVNPGLGVIEVYTVIEADADK
jgi:hypothetical protein